MPNIAQSHRTNTNRGDGLMPRAGGEAGCRDRNGAVTSAVLVHLRVEPAHFDWRWRERPALALLAWEAMARDPLARLRRIQAESIGTTINFRAGGYHQSRHRSIALADRI